MEKNPVIILPNINIRSVNHIARVEILTESPTDINEDGEMKKQIKVHDKNVDVMDISRTTGKEYSQVITNQQIKIYKKAQLVPKSDSLYGKKSYSFKVMDNADKQNYKSA